MIDVDNTLLDFEKSSQLALIRTCEDFDIPYSERMLEVFLEVNNSMWRQIQDGELTKAQLWERRFNTIFNKLGINADGVLFETEFHRHIETCAATVDGAVDALKYLHSKYTVCTASNASFKQQRIRLELAGMLQYIDKMFVSEHLGAQKPNVAFFEECFEQLAFSPEETVMIGDDLHADMLGASTYNLHTCWYNPKHLPNDENISIDTEISDLSELKSIF
ncbi:MAG: YjjG family noncanonical pyrimidine nucleotidase [Clostridia bacterium]|nr:YjjG family noncanonical pyrimidine nucleotidase [Clostridia bacterium]